VRPLLGAQISSEGTSVESVFKVTSSLDGSGAEVAVGKVNGTAYPLTGSSTNTSYFADGVDLVKTTFKIGTPNAMGISVVTGSGKCLAGGTGVHKREKCSFTAKGTYNTKTTITSLTVTGLRRATSRYRFGVRSHV
jgi:hypothetical protein